VDTATHALLGALVARTATSKRSRLDTRELLLLGAGAAAFPDIDFLGFPIDPLIFLADWHQGPTHSLVLLPLWALLLGGIFVAVIRRRGVFFEATAVCALALASHIASDAITAYGTRILDPLSDRRISFDTTFVIDPLFTGLIILALGASLWTGRRSIAGLGLLALCVYVGERGIAAGGVAALPQPFSPFNWKLVVTEGPWLHQTHVNLAGHPPPVPDVLGLRRLRAVAAAYRPPPDAVWVRRHRFGDGEEWRVLAEALWQRPDFEPFRRFAAHPALSRTDRSNGETCVWFTDLRYDLPELPDTFRYGFCRDASDAPWRLYRLRYFTEAARQALR
jgi:inner membrane protein